jgi:type II secretory pathway component PulF
LQLAADGVRDANFREISLSLAIRVQQGRSLAESIAADVRLPASLSPLVGWGERSGDLAGACQTAADVFEGRMRLRSELLRSVVPPLVFIAIATLALVTILGVYAPLVSMIQWLV